MEVLDRKPDESSSGYHARLRALNLEGWSDQHLNLRAEQLWAVPGGDQKSRRGAKGFL